MASYIGRDNKTIYILDKQLKSGGEGVVYSIVGKPNLVAKIYKAERVADTTMREATRDKILAIPGLQRVSAGLHFLHMLTSFFLCHGSSVNHEKNLLL